MRFGLRAKFWMIVLVAACFLFGIGAVAWRQQSAGVEQLIQLSDQAIGEASLQSEERRALALSQMVADGIVNALYYFDLVFIGETARLVLGLPGISYVLIYNGDGRILHDGSADISRFGQRMGDDFAVAAISAKAPLIQREGFVLDAAVPIFLSDERIGGVRVGLSLAEPSLFHTQTMTSVHESVRRLQERMVVPALILVGILLFLALICAGMISWRLVRPIGRLAQAARQMEQGDFSVSFPISGRQDEIGELEEALFRMSESVSRHDREIRRLAYSDHLTSLPNRVAFRELLNAKVISSEQENRQLALLFIDLDDFKRVNDTSGHDTGDDVIRCFAERVSKVTSSFGSGCHVARFGGDEFVVLLSSNDVRERASRLAQALLAEIRQPIEIGKQSVVLAASIGVTIFPDDASEPTALLKNADIAMYRAKLDGKNCFRYYTRDMDVAVEQQMQMEQDLRRALEHGELSVVYQPIYDLSDGELIGAEALVRWNHPQHGKISPELFISVAEQTGQIEAIGSFVLRTACLDAAGWSKRESAPFVSVNISAKQLQSGNLPDLVERELKISGLAAQRLYLELTETAMFSREREAILASTRLRAAGVRVWLDDFGTGFSGLSHLRKVPVDGVKIDRSFVSGMLVDSDDLALTAAVIAMAHSLDISVTAEGVETKEQYEALKARGCDSAQGYWLGRPMASEELQARIHQ